MTVRPTNRPSTNQPTAQQTNLPTNEHESKSYTPDNCLDHCNIKFCLLVVKVSIKLMEVCNANKITTKVQTVIMTKRKIEKYIETYIDMFQLW